MSVKQSFSSSSYSTSSSVASLSTNSMKSSTSSDSTSCQALLQSSRDIGRKMAAARCPSKESDSSGRSFLSVRKNDSLMRSRANMVERSITQGSQLRLLLSEIDVICIFKDVFLSLVTVLCTSLFLYFQIQPGSIHRKNVVRLHQTLMWAITIILISREARIAALAHHS